MTDLIKIGKNAKAASRVLNSLSTIEKNNALEKVASTLLDNTEKILAANDIDIKNARENNMKESLIDRLALSKERIADMAKGVKDVATAPDPVGEVLSMVKRPNGLLIGKKRVPIGVIGIIYEARPNVTSDAFALCFKSGNAVILKGGSDAINSNIAIANSIREGLKSAGCPEDSIILIEDTDRSVTKEFMKLNDYVDALIPRGSAGLIKFTVENSSIPVIETGSGNCHIYVDEFADFKMAADIIVNAKTQRTGVCNACESLVVHKKIAKDFIPYIADILIKKGVEIRGDELATALSDKIVPATDEDWSTEYLDMIISLKTVENIDEAILHINENNTGHSESIITNDYHNAQIFLERIDAAAVYVNASTRFTDGGEFGFGAEIGISTQKLHARGPMGLKELTTNKYIIYGDGQIR